MTCCIIFKKCSFTKKLLEFNHVAPNAATFSSFLIQKGICYCWVDSWDRRVTADKCDNNLFAEPLNYFLLDYEAVNQVKASLKEHSLSHFHNIKKHIINKVLISWLKLLKRKTIPKFRFFIGQEELQYLIFIVLLILEIPYHFITYK